MAVRTVEGSRLTSRQQRELRAARTALGEAAGVRAYAAGRANPRWSSSAQWLVGIFVGTFLFLFVVFHVFLIPGFLLVYLLYDGVKPRRGIAVTSTGVAELKLSVWNGRPDARVLANVDHAALFPPRIEVINRRNGVRFGSEGVSVSDADLRRLQAVVPTAVPVDVSGDAPPLPPPPG